MARNRKRAKERRDRRPQPISRPRLAPARANGGDALPSPIEHAAPDVELAEAQLELGRPDLVDDGELAGDGAGVDEANALNSDQLATVGDSQDAPQASEAAVGAVAVPGAPQPKQGLWSRIIGFLQGSWRELQRVQWPDRRQVVQATAVVIGFVIVAGVFLGLSDTAASHLMSYIITGKSSIWAWVAIGVVVVSAVGWALTDRDK